MSETILRLKIGALLQLSAALEWANHRAFLCIDRSSDALVRIRWEKVRNATRRR